MPPPIPTINVNLANVSGNTLNGRTSSTGGYNQAPFSYLGTAWNEADVAPTAMTDLLDSEGNATTVGFTTTPTTTAFFMTGPNNWADHPNVPLLQGGVIRVFNSGSGNTMHNRFTITGLTPGDLYHVVLAGCQNDTAAGQWGIGTASVAPTSTKTIINTLPKHENWMAGNNYTVFYRAAADVDGKIFVWGKGQPGTGGYANGLALNGFQIVKAADLPSPENDMLSFTVAEGASTIVGTNVTLYVPPGTDVSALVPTITVSSGASVSPFSGVENNFNTQDTFTVTAESGAPKTYTVAIVYAAASGNVYVNVDNTTRTGLVGPGGGLGETWNQLIGGSASSASGLIDSAGVPSSVGYTSTNLTGPDGWGNPALDLLKVGLRNFDTSASNNQQLVINGLTAGKKYDVYLASANCDTGNQRSYGVWNTPTSGDHVCDNRTTLIGDTWVEGNNYAFFANVEADVDGKITFNGYSIPDGVYDIRLPLNGFQVKTVPTELPGAPSDLVATPSYNKVVLTWAGSTGAQGYSVKRSESPGTETEIGTTTGATTYTDTTGTPGITYFYVVSATNIIGESLLTSNEVSASPLEPPPGPPVVDYARWFDASQIIAADGDPVSTWNDLSTNAADATVPGGNATPVYVADSGTESGLGAVYFAKNGGAGDSAALLFTRDSNIRTVFSVFKGNSFLLTDQSEYHFHRETDDNPTDPLWNGYTSGNITGGSTYVNGTLVNGLSFPMPTDLHNGFNLVEVLLTNGGTVQADSFNKDRGGAHAGNQYQAEVIIYDRVLSEEERLSVETYLTNKWFPTTPQAKILAFGPGATIGPVVDSKADIAWTVPYGTNPATLTPTFTLSSGASCTVGGLTVTTGDLVDFTTNPRHFIVTSSDSAIVNDYTVTVSVTPISTACDILTFGLPGNPATITGTDIAWSVPFGTDLATLAPEYTVSEFANGVPTTGSAPDFSINNPATYTVTAQDGVTSKPYHVTVTVLPEWPTLVNVNYYGGSKPGNADMDGIASYDATARGSASQVAPAAYSGTTWNDFSSATASGSNLLDSKGNSTSIGLTTTMQNGPWNDWNGLSGNRMLVSAVLAGYTNYTPIITLSGLDTGHSYDLYIASRLNNDNRPADYTIGSATRHLQNTGATDWTEGDCYVHFTNVIPQPDGTLVVKAMTTSDWAGICVNGFQLQDMGVRGLNPEANIYSFTFPGFGDAIISGTNVSIVVPYGTAVTGLQPTYVASVGASGDPAPGVSTDFTGSETTPVPYAITSEDGNTTTTYNVSVTVAPPPPGGTSVGPVCWYDTSDGVTTNEGGQILSWNDLSGYAHHGTPQNGPTLVADQLNGKPAAQLRGQWLNLAGTFFVKEQYVVVRSPYTAAWGGYGAFLGRASGRGSSYLLTPENTTMWNDQSADAVSKNGTPVPKNQNNNYIFDLAPINEYMLLKIVVNNNDTTAAAYQIGRADGMSCDMDIVEIIGYAGMLSQADENLVGAYVAGKYGLTINIPSTEPIAFGPTGTGTLTFDAAPAKSEWSTLAVSGGSGDITTDVDIDNAISGIAASSINTELTTQAGSGTSGTAYWRSGDQKLGTQPTGVSMTLLMATLKNTSGGTVDNMTVNYTMGLASLTPGEAIKGHRVYWSKDGATWTAVADYLLASPGTLAVSFDLTSLAWASGELLYVVWADDNGTTNPDGDYTIDDVNFGPYAPKPVAGFTADPTFGQAPLLVAFTDTSSGVDISNVNWDFGDGSAAEDTAWGDGASHTYAAIGTYTVTQTVTNPNGSSIATSVISVVPTPPVATGLACWYAADIGVTTDGSGVLSWDDISGNGHTANRGNGTVTLVPDEVNSLPAVQLRGGNTYLDCAVDFSSIVKEQYVVVRSPNATWNGSGSFLGRASNDFLTVRGSSYNMTSGTTGFWQDHFPVAVSKNGTSVPAGSGSTHFLLDPITDYMIVKIVVDNDGVGNIASYPNYQIGKNETLGTMDFDVAEILGFDHMLTGPDEVAVGTYLKTKYGLVNAYVPYYAIESFGPGAVIDQDLATITWTVPPGSDVTTLAPTYTVSAYAREDATYPSGTERDFTDPVTYTITDADLNPQKTYTVTVIVGTAPTNDNFVDAIALPGNSGIQTGTGNKYATLETGEPDPGTGGTNTVWFKWTCAADGNLTVRTLGSTNLIGGEWDAVLGIYSGSPVDALTPLGTTPQDTFLDETMTVAVTAGTIYHIQLAGFLNDVAANILLTWTFVGGGGVSYADWALANGVTGEPNEDSNNDGVQNGIAYFMDATGLATNPGLDAGGTVTWPVNSSFLGTYEVQTSADLANWIAADPQPTPAGGNLTYTLDPGLGKQFVRLLVTPTP